MNRSHLLAASLLVILSLWMLSGAFSSDPQATTTSQPTAPEKPRMKVKVSEQQAQQINREIVLQGKLEPIRQVEVKSQLAAKVKSLTVDKGIRVNAGDLLVELEIDDRLSRLQQVNAEIEHLRLEVKAAEELLGKGLNSENALRSAQANLATAVANQQAARLAIDYTKIHAPFSGVWEQRHVEKGSHLDVGHSVGLLVDSSTIKAVGYVSQQAVTELTLGQTVEVTLLNGTVAIGVLSYIANLGEATTQSFRIEADIPNTPARLRAGSSAQIRIQTGVQMAHFVSPSAFSLGADGEVGIKSVDGSGKVKFYPVELVKKDLNGVWVTGLPDSVSLITLGQGFVEAGEQVTAVRG